MCTPVNLIIIIFYMRSRVHPAKINKLNFIINICTQNKIVLTAIKIQLFFEKKMHIEN